MFKDVRYMAKYKRFERAYTQSGELGVSVEILVDRETGVNYMFYRSGYAGGLTPLLDKDGNVVVTPTSEQ